MAVVVIDGDNQANTLDGDSALNLIRGFGGNDTIFGGDVPPAISLHPGDTLDGGEGRDSITGGSGSISGLLLGGAGDDTLVSGSGWTDTLVGGTGDDLFRGADGTHAVVSYRERDGWAPSTGVVVDLGARQGTDGSGGTDRFQNIDAAEGTEAHGDVLTGNADRNTLRGGGGDDTLSGGRQSDYLAGGEGADVLIGGQEADFYFVEDAGDTIIEEADGGTFDMVKSAVGFILPEHVEMLELNPGDVGLIVSAGNSGHNTVYGSGGDDQINGRGGNDALYGSGASGEGADSLTGGGGADTLWGGVGHDLLDGGEGGDNLDGGVNQDTLIGGDGADTLDGGAGADVFRFGAASEGGDRILRYRGGTDQVEVSASGFGGGIAAGEDLVASGRYIENRSGEAKAALGQFVFERDTKQLWWDADGTGTVSARQLIFTLDGAREWSGSEIVVIA